ncbi:TPA: hypothetical protein L4559_003539 [Pseudomonas aeruginosa]|nr:hypothetical protein [Pseudomonas aeruginosa]
MWVLFVAVSLVLTGCAAQSPETVIDTAPGFWLGLWHGYIAVFAMIGHLFDSSIAVYAVPNNGGWYAFGFLIGIAAFGGSGVGVASDRR